jgi:hypothetical protein
MIIPISRRRGRTGIGLNLMSFPMIFAVVVADAAPVTLSETQSATTRLIGPNRSYVKVIEEPAMVVTLSRFASNSIRSHKFSFGIENDVAVGRVLYFYSQVSSVRDLRRDKHYVAFFWHQEAP